MSIETCCECINQIDTDENVEGEYKPKGFICEDCLINEESDDE